MPTEEQIRQRAQEIWEENHRPTGRDDEFWYQAEKELNEGLAHEPTSPRYCPDSFVAINKNCPICFGQKFLWHNQGVDSYICWADSARVRYRLRVC
jgi:hypothetical protein